MSPSLSESAGMAIAAEALENVGELSARSWKTANILPATCVTDGRRTQSHPQARTRGRGRTWKLLSFQPGFLDRNRTTISASTFAPSSPSHAVRASIAASRTFQFESPRSAKTEGGRNDSAWASASSCEKRYLRGSAGAAPLEGGGAFDGGAASFLGAGGPEEVEATGGFLA